MTINIRNILLLDEFLQSCRMIMQDKWKYLFLFFQFFIFADMWKYCRADEILLLNCALSGLLALHRKVEWNKVAIVMLVCCLVFLIPIIKYGLDSITISQYLGYLIRILTACFIASYYRRDFIVKFENLVFILAYISIPLYIIQLIDPHLFDIFTSLSKAIMAGRQGYDTPNGITMHQYLVIFVMNGWAQIRNSGFMWEPASFGAMLSWACLMSMYLHSFRLRPRMIIYAVAIISTFSLGTYFYAFLLLLLFLLQNSSVKQILMVSVFLLVTFYMFSKTDFFEEPRNMMLEKAETYMNTSETELELSEENFLADETKIKRVNRLAQFFIIGEFILEDPFGRGMASWKYSSGNGFIRLLVMFGLGGLFLLFFLSRKMVKYLESFLRVKYVQRRQIVVFSSMLVLMLPLVGNPIYNQVLWLTILIYPIFAKPYTYYNSYER